MKKFEGMLFCTDLDGTLLSDDKTVSNENLEAIEYFKSEGGRFTFITGRPPQIAGDIYEKIKPNAPVGCFNGGGVYDFASKKYLWNTCLAEEAIELIECVDKQLPDVGIQPNTTERLIFSKDNTAMEWFRDITGAPNIYCDYKTIPEPVIKVLFAHFENERILRVAELLNNHPKAYKFDFIRSEQTLYELLPKGISKGNVMLKIAEFLNIDPKNTVAVGDYNNDISMIKAAGIGYAVQNAVPEAKAVADRITVSNNDHAIAAIINEL